MFIVSFVLVVLYFLLFVVLLFASLFGWLGDCLGLVVCGWFALDCFVWLLVIVWWFMLDCGVCCLFGCLLTLCFVLLLA